MAQCLAIRAEKERKTGRMAHKGKKENTILYSFRHGCDDISNTVSRKTYTRGAEGFAEFLREQGINKVSKLDSDTDREQLQRYADALIASGKSASTIHTYVAGAAHALGSVRGKHISIADIIIPKRGASTRSRDMTRNRQGRIEAAKPENSRLVSFASMVGLRRDEYKKLDGRSFRPDESGYMCVWVKGKGGKLQAQRILPLYQSDVAAVMAQIAGKEKVFSKEELKNKIDLHGMRRQVAQTAYTYYCQRLSEDPQYRLRLQNELVKRWDDMHPQNRPEADKKAKKGFLDDIKGMTYVCRGKNAEILRRTGRSPVLDKLAVMAVSVFHLSHWRADVTVKNYLV